MLISDFLADDDLPAAIRGTRAAGHDLLLLHVMDPAERDFAFAAEAVFVDPEREEGVPAVPVEVRGAYVATVRRVLQEWSETAGAAGADHVLVDTAAPFGVVLREALARRERLP